MDGLKIQTNDGLEDRSPHTCYVKMAENVKLLKNYNGGQFHRLLKDSATNGSLNTKQA